MSGGSAELRRYRIARRDGATMMTACVQSGISLDEARLIEADDKKNPPGPECFEPLDTNSLASGSVVTGAIGAPHRHDEGSAGAVPAHPTGSFNRPLPQLSTTEGTDMARAARKPKDDEPEQNAGEPDFAKAVRIYHGDIKPAVAKVGEHNQVASEGYKAIAKQCNVQRAAAKAAFKLKEMEFDKVQEWLWSFKSMCAALGVGLEADLFAEAIDNEVVPIAERKPVELVTVQ